MSFLTHVNKALFEVEFGVGVAYEKVMRFLFDNVSLEDFVKEYKPTTEEVKEIATNYNPLALYERATLLDALTDESGVEVALVEIIELHDIKPKTLYEVGDLLDSISDAALLEELEERGLLDT